MNLSIFLIAINDLGFVQDGRMVGFGHMKKAELANHEARRQRVAPGSAADQMDRAVSEIIRALRSGRPAELPGLGTIQPGKRWIFHPVKRRLGLDSPKTDLRQRKTHGQ